MVGLVVILLVVRWYFNKPKYDKVDLPAQGVLDLSEAVFIHQMKKGFNGKLIPAKSFYLRIFEGYPDRSFYSRFKGRGFPRVERNYLKNANQHERDASLSIDNIVDNREYLSVTATIKYCYDKIENIEYHVVRENSKWSVEQSEYPREMLANLISANKAFQRNNLRCTSIIR
jgi:hypothetical protein